MELRHLRYFVAVATEKSFRRAAERLHIAQPPLSMQIRQLEEEFGVRLFERTSRSVKLTSVAEDLLPLATNILANSESLLRTAKQRAQGTDGMLSIGYLPSSLGPLLVETLKRFRASHPRVQISLVEQRAPQQVEAILGGSLDVGLAHGEVDRQGLLAEPFMETSIALALPRGHRLARKKEISLKSLQGEQLILLRPELSCGFYDSFLKACAAAGVVLPVVQYTSDFMTKLWLVSAGFGISPTMLPLMALPRGNVVFRPIAAHLPKSKLFLIRRKTDQSPLVQQFVDHLKQAHIGRTNSLWISPEDLG